MKMNIETIKQLAELAQIFESGETKPPADSVLAKEVTGQQIVVCDRGFVYVGTVTVHGDCAIIENGKNIRKWGTTKGLGELVNGPLKDTVSDPVGRIVVPIKAVIHFIKCNNW